MSASSLIVMVVMVVGGISLPGVRGQINALASVLQFVDSEEGRMSSQVLERPTESKWAGRDVPCIN